MIKVTVELVSAISPSRSRVLHIGEIWNLRERTIESKGKRGDYGYRLFQRGSKTKVWRSGSIKNFPRQSSGMWELMYRVLLDVFLPRSK